MDHPPQACVRAADTNRDGTVSSDEDAAYKKRLASAETKAKAQVQEHKNNSVGATTSTSGSVAVFVDASASSVAQIPFIQRWVQDCPAALT